MPISLPPVSRRRFLQGALAAAGGLALGARWSWADAAASGVDPNRLALLSDTHLDAKRKLLHKTQISMWNQFSQASDEICALKTRPAAVLINGDCAHSRGMPGDYVTVVDALKPMRAAGLPIHLTLGNHDNRANFLAALPDDDKRVAALTDRCVTVLQLPFADWYMLDSLEKTSSTPGVLGAAQLEWLKTALDSRPDRPAVVMMHHQPDNRPLEKRSGLADTPEFIEVVQPRKQVKAVLFGHTHVWMHYKNDGLHFINLPTTAYVFVPMQPAGWVDAQLSADKLTLQLHAITPEHPKDKETIEFAWR